MTTKRKSYSAINTNPESAQLKSELEGASPAEQADIHGVGSKETKNFDAANIIVASNEKLIKKGNSSIRLGKDRNSNLYSGAGGKGHSHCAAIDIVAGHYGFMARERDNRGRKLYVHPDFTMDAARIYVSQKSDIDSYLRINRPKGGGSTSDAKGYYKSTVALKADTIRVVARESIRLVTRTDDLDSQGGQLSNADKSGYGIDLIACNDPEELQPMVKGDNLVDCLNAMLQVVENVSTILDNFISYQQELNRDIMSHTHMSPFYGTETAPDFKQVMMAGVENAINVALNCQVPMIADIPLNNVSVVNDYLDNSGVAGEKYILSLYNRTN
jgi:hypothetical protein